MPKAKKSKLVEAREWSVPARLVIRTSITVAARTAEEALQSFAAMANWSNLGADLDAGEIVDWAATGRPRVA